ncbi:hypothetical protein P1X14_07320 [Sphingomonas sp. AOB5]|uniref:hypothetical protein n=1 Tax=Sphingomonas sp. AOB5 TaxID=3034017 RepID=UPI0023F87006|nr:hypothetical protein [Sphingomonas sp. AOB5]MDF7775050.1 hypothetical protein [Sphingomonas sp. AOB5]
MNKTIVLASGLLLALGAAACTDQAAVAKAEADARAASAKKAANRARDDKIARNVTCLSALRWQEGALSRAGIGPVKLYTDHYREELAKVIGSDTVEAPPAPALSAASMDPYLDWAYPESVKGFTAGKDANGDGEISGNERSAAGFSTVLACVQFVAEFGKGPLAGKDKVARMYRIQDLRTKLKDKDA